jgi:hypothetical protein
MHGVIFCFIRYFSPKPKPTDRTPFQINYEKKCLDVFQKFDMILTDNEGIQLTNMPNSVTCHVFLDICSVAVKTMRLFASSAC